MSETKKKSYLLVWCVVSLVVLYFLLQVGIPWMLKVKLGREQLVPTPLTLVQWFMSMGILGCLVYVTSSEQRIREFQSFLVPDKSDVLGSMLCKLILIAIPLVVGWTVFSMSRTGSAAPIELCIQHPSNIPEVYRNLENPLRNPNAEMLAKFKEKQELEANGKELRKAFEQACIQEGRILYQATCRVCHGTKTDGNGPFARGYRRRPVDFTIKDTIATITESVAFWRIKEGGSKHSGGGGVPSESCPWDSAMPAWKNDFTDEQIWKIIMAEYDTAHVKPRVPEKIEH